MPRRADPDPLEGLPLAAPTPPGWAEKATSDLNALLADHAHCELKAASTAMSLVGRFADKPELVRDLSALAHEEMRHFERVHQLLRARGRSLPKVSSDRYVRALKEAKLPRRAGVSPFVDQLILCAFIEARSCERFRLLTRVELPAELAALYREFATAEARHHEIFLHHAEAEAGPRALRERVAEVAKVESEIVGTLPLEPKIH